MVRLAVALISASVIAAFTRAASPSSGDLQQRHLGQDILAELRSDLFTAAALSGVDLSALEHISLSTFKTASGITSSSQYEADQKSGTTTVTINSSTSNNANYSGNRGIILKRSTPSNLVRRAPQISFAGMSPEKLAAKTQPKSKGGRASAASSAKPAAPAGKTYINSKTTNQIQTNNAKMNNNQGTIVDSGNVYGHYDACTVMIQGRDLVDGVLQARARPHHHKSSSSGGGQDRCACNCGLERRSSGGVSIAGPDAQALQARLEPTCSIMQNVASGQHLWAGSCAGSTLAGRAITDVLPPFAS